MHCIPFITLHVRIGGQDGDGGFVGEVSIFIYKLQFGGKRRYIKYLNAN